MTRKPCENHISKTKEGNFAYFWLQMYLGSKMCWLAFGVKSWKVKVTASNDPKTLWTPYLTNKWREFYPILITDVFGFVVLIRFWDQSSKVKVTSPWKQGKYYIFVIIWANFTKIRWCMYLGRGHTDYVERSKVKVTAGARHHILHTKLQLSATLVGLFLRHVNGF